MLNLSQPAASALAQVFGGLRRLQHPRGPRRPHQQVFVVYASTSVGTHGQFCAFDSAQGRAVRDFYTDFANEVV